MENGNKLSELDTTLFTSVRKKITRSSKKYNFAIESCEPVKIMSNSEDTYEDITLSSILWRNGSNSHPGSPSMGEINCNYGINTLKRHFNNVEGELAIERGVSGGVYLNGSDPSRKRRMCLLRAKHLQRLLQGPCISRTSELASLYLATALRNIRLKEAWMSRCNPQFESCFQSQSGCEGIAMDLSSKQTLIKGFSAKSNFLTLKSFLENNFGGYKFSCPNEYHLVRVCWNETSRVGKNPCPSPSIGSMEETDVCVSDYESAVGVDADLGNSWYFAETSKKSNKQGGSNSIKVIEEDCAVECVEVEVVGEDELIEYDDQEEVLEEETQSSESEVANWVGFVGAGQHQLMCEKCKVPHTIKKLISISECLHKFCSVCISLGVHSQLNQVIMTCPALSLSGQKSCNAHLSLTIIEEVVSANSFMKWMEFVSYRISKELSAYAQMKKERRQRFSGRDVGIATPPLDSKSMSIPSPNQLERSINRACPVKGGFRMPQGGKEYDSSYFS